MIYYEPKHFSIKEYVPPDIYNELGDGAIVLLDDRLLRSDDAIREFFGKAVTINNWHLDGGRSYSGFRPPWCKTGAKWGQHRFGRASDKIIRDISADEARKTILKNRKAFPHIRAMELGVPWLHTDCRPTKSDEIFLFNP